MLPCLLPQAPPEVCLCHPHFRAGSPPVLGKLLPGLMRMPSTTGTRGSFLDPLGCWHVCPLNFEPHCIGYAWSKGT